MPAYQKLKRDFKKKFLRALRSGSYKQGYSTLRRQPYGTEESCFCALGVAADVVDPRGWRRDAERFSTWSHRGDSTGLVQQTLVETGLTVRSTERLCYLNDGLNWSLPQIADWVEKRL